MRRESLSALLVALLVGGGVGCKSAVEKCNESKVATYDAWDALGRDLASACGTYRTPDMMRMRRRAADSMARFNAMQPTDSAAMTFIFSAGQIYDPLEEACDAVGRARDSARGGAVPSREASQSAIELLRTVAGKVTEQPASAPDPAESEPQRLSREGRAAVREAFARVRLDERLMSLEATTRTRWELCQSVEP